MIGVKDDNGIFDFSKIVSGTQFVKQRVEENVRTLKGELFDDIDKGIPWLYYLNANLEDVNVRNALKEDVMKACLETDGVTDVESCDITIKAPKNGKIKNVVCIELKYNIDSSQDVIDSTIYVGW